MQRPALVFEDIQSAPRRFLFRLLGIPVYATSLAWLNPILVFLGSLLLALLLHPALDLAGQAGRAAMYAALGLATLFVHSIGHIVSGKAAGAPMDALLLTATRHINIYEGSQEGYPPRVHILRSLGGPAANLLAGGVGLVLLALSPSVSVALWALFNLGGGLGALLPIESVDGGEIFRQWRRLQQTRQKVRPR